MNCIAAVMMGVSWGGMTVRGTHIHPIRALICLGDGLVNERLAVDEAVAAAEFSLPNCDICCDKGQANSSLLFGRLFTIPYANFINWMDFR